MTGLWRQALEIARKDLRTEMRSGEVLMITVPFGAAALMLIPLAIGVDAALLDRVGPGMYWSVILLFGVLVTVRQSAADGAGPDGPAHLCSAWIRRPFRREGGGLVAAPAGVRDGAGAHRAGAVRQRPAGMVVGARPVLAAGGSGARPPRHAGRSHCRQRGLDHPGAPRSWCRCRFPCCWRPPRSPKVSAWGPLSSAGCCCWWSWTSCCAVAGVLSARPLQRRRVDPSEDLAGPRCRRPARGRSGRCRPVPPERNPWGTWHASCSSMCPPPGWPTWRSGSLWRAASAT